MKTRKLIIHPVFVFILAQLAWLTLVGLWIYWYVSNYIILEQVGDKLSPQIISKSTNILALVSGCVMLVVLLGGMYLIFIYLTKQINITRLYDNFIANITHELKSPLASLQLYLETLKMRNIPESRRQEFIHLMLKDARRLKNLINSILEISAIEQKKMAYHYQVYPAESLVRQLIWGTEERFKLPPDTIRITGEAPCQWVADRNAMKIVFDNLIDNALKYSGKEFELTVKMSCNSKQLYLEFIDNGVGIPASEQKKIFNKFYRIYGKHIPNIKGTGLGLYMVQEIVKLHGGTISVHSDGYNCGTTFRIEFPIYRESKKHFLEQLLAKTQNLKSDQQFDYEEESIKRQ